MSDDERDTMMRCVAHGGALTDAGQTVAYGPVSDPVG
jgi:hypothetical protein